ncbi:MAG: amidohydrolase [Paenibacillaceae bacterium]|nr:amidohydrolase [Paenibacillaceae bacterium]
MIIDGHSHVTLPIEEHISIMNKAGVDKTVLFFTTFHPETSVNFEEISTSIKFLNDLLAGKKGSMVEARKKAATELATAIARYPDRYVGFGAVPIGLDLHETLQYVNDVIYKNSLTGMGEFTPGNGQIHLMKNIFRASVEFNHLPVWIHAFFPLTIQDIHEIAALALEYPETPVILGHLGGCNWLETINLVKEIPNLYLDTSAYYSTFVLGAVINEVPDKCLFGVDRPFGDLQISIDTILRLANSSEISDAVLGGNIARLLQITE